MCVSCERFECFDVADWNVVMDTARPHLSETLLDQSPPTSRDSAFSAFLSGRSTWEPGAPQHLPYKRMALHGLPIMMRREIWPLFLGIDRIKRQYTDCFWDKVKQGDGVDADTRGRIGRDLDRTFPTDAFFQTADGRQKLNNVLLACAAFDPKLGYTQGMAFCAGMFLIHGICEEDSFWCMIALSCGEAFTLRGIWAPELDDNKVWESRRKAIWHIVRERAPEFLDWVGEDEDELADMVILPFLPSLFCNRFSTEAAARVLDAFFLVGWEPVVTLMATLLHRAWLNMDPNTIDCRIIAPTILPLMFSDSKGQSAEVTSVAWCSLLPKRAPPVYVPPPSSPALLKDEQLYKTYIVI